VSIVEKVLDFLVGTVVLRLMRGVMTPPVASISSDKRSDIKKEGLNLPKTVTAEH